MTQRSSTPRSEPRRPSDWLRLVLPILLIGTFIVVGWRAGYFKLEGGARLNAAADRAREIPWLGPLFTAVYGIVAAFAAPVSPLAYGAGALFGIIRGVVTVWVGSMIGAIAGYWLARRALAGATKRLLGRHQARLRELGKNNAFLVTLRAQLLPFIPFGIFNYAAGAARIPFIPYAAATAIGIIPGSIAAVFVGERIAAGIRGASRGPFLVAGTVMVALIAASFLPGLIERARRGHYRIGFGRD